MNSARNILIRVDGSKRIGMGHVYRMLTLARHLKRKYGFTLVFVVRNCASSVSLILRSGFTVATLPFGISLSQEVRKLADMLRFYRPFMVIADVLHFARDSRFMGSLRYDKDVVLVAYNDDNKRRLVDADIVFSSDFSQQPALYNKEARTRYYVGFDYLILNEDYGRVNKNIRKINKSIRNVVVCMGGVDQHNLTAKVLRAIDGSCIDFKCEVVVNSNFFDKGLARRLADNSKHDISFNFDVDSLVKYFSKADLAITSGGLVHLERMCSGTPGIVINQHARQADLSLRIMRQEATFDLGLHSQVSASEIIDSFNNLSRDYSLRAKMAAKGKELVDGKGLARIVNIINQAVRAK